MEKLVQSLYRLRLSATLAVATASLCMLQTPVAGARPDSVWWKYGEYPDQVNCQRVGQDGRAKGFWTSYDCRNRGNWHLWVYS